MRCQVKDCNYQTLLNISHCNSHCTAEEWLAERDRTVSDRKDQTGVMAPVGRSPYAASPTAAHKLPKPKGK